ncbi:MAG: thioredoxin family protein [Methylorubrum extorquens]|jgi:thioredoxin 1|uniref:Thioredoxin-related n=1 Tax=Methylorubrum extorquens (strain DSM 6343 / CIP 106787 / DM4) TaxID=661410 RepID=C7C730_METED|nr:thioredoxin family protein [Methylorubrum extorquens]CAX24076.1 thioredoxin-related [Methylorubrum extorquens DM4]
MTNRRHVLILAAAFLAGNLPGSGQAADPTAYDQSAFEAAQAAGRPILVQISAPWCPICRAQKPILAALSADPRFKTLAVFTIDFDAQRDLVRRFGAQMQSTLIVYKGGTEVARSVGETQPEWIEQLLEKAL